MPTITELFDQALTFHQAGDIAKAEPLYRRLLAADNLHADSHNNLGIILGQKGLLAEAAQCFRLALASNNDHGNAHYNLGTALVELGQLAEAGACFLEALRLDPRRADAHNNLGNVYKEQGQLEEAVASFRMALELRPDYITAHNNLVYTLHICPGLAPQTILAECENWNRQHAALLAGLIQAPQCDATPGRRLRIGYVSPDFRSHPVGRFILPLLAAHDRGQVEVFGYSSVKKPDALTERCRGLVDAWRPITHLTDDQTAQLIRGDRIDILVDLAMHTMDNRLLVFARKPAPIQVTYLAYGGTTGLHTMDYRLTDPYLDPPGRNDAFYSEKSTRLPHTYWVYQPVSDTPVAAEPPSVATGQITFGCLNNFCKVTSPTLELWGQVLQACPGAALLLYARQGSHRDRVCRVLERWGVAADRLTFVDWLPVADYFRTYSRLDVALDPFPYGGGTTTCDALWMGVPVVSLVGQTAVGRGGLSILSNVGLQDLAATDTAQYVQTAVALARDRQRLRELRATLRTRMQASPLMDVPAFARGVEEAYRQMWRHYRGTMA